MAAAPRADEHTERRINTLTSILRSNGITADNNLKASLLNYFNKASVPEFAINKVMSELIRAGETPPEVLEQVHSELISKISKNNRARSGDAVEILGIIDKVLKKHGGHLDAKLKLHLERILAHVKKDPEGFLTRISSKEGSKDVQNAEINSDIFADSILSFLSAHPFPPHEKAQLGGIFHDIHNFSKGGFPKQEVSRGMPARVRKAIWADRIRRGTVAAGRAAISKFRRRAA